MFFGNENKIRTKAMRKIDYIIEIEKIMEFLRDYLLKSGLKKYIVGISGGIDSALSAALARYAIGNENVHGVLMPYRDSHPDSTRDGIELCKKLDISYEIRDISPLVDLWFQQNEISTLRKGNWMARIRMNILFDLSAQYAALVLGTTNYSEWMTGYFTQFGDSACALEPIGRLYKTEVWEMSRALDIPKSIVEKIPTADLWLDQSDEEEMGIGYAELDDILYAIDTRAVMDSFAKDKVELVHNLIARSAYKRIPAPMPEHPCSI